MVHNHLGVTVSRDEIRPPALEFRHGPIRPYFRQTYLQVATDAGIMLGDITEGFTPAEFWINSLLSHLQIDANNVYVETSHHSGGGSIRMLCEASAMFCAWLDVRLIEQSTLGYEGTLHRAVVEAVASTLNDGQDQKIPTVDRTNSPPPTRAQLRETYFIGFSNEKIKVLDVCWAAEQHYREWKRWLQNPSPIKDGSTADLAFRRILTSGKRPIEYRALARPNNWQ